MDDDIVPQVLEEIKEDFKKWKIYDTMKKLTLNQQLLGWEFVRWRLNNPTNKYIFLK